MNKNIRLAFLGFLAVSFTIAGSEVASDVLRKDPSEQTAQEDLRILRFERQVVALEDRAQPDARQWSLEERLYANGVPGVGIAIIENGKIALARGYGALSASSDDPVNENSVFSAGSVSKLVNSALILRLVQAGELDLDQDVNTYLTSWTVPDTELTAKHKVTLRALLSHTSGLSQHGFPDFAPNEETPSLLQTLNGLPPAKHSPVRLLFEPGSQMKYSGGGISVSQLVVETVTGLPYAKAAKVHVFEPLGMSRSTFASPLPKTHGNIAKAHDRNGKPRALPRGYETMPEVAASGLWTSAKDMAIFINALLDGEFLSEDLRKDMLTREQRSWHGLGPRLNGIDEKFVFHHGGSNNSYQAWVEGHPAQSNGIVILTNGEGGRKLAYELRIAAERAFDWQVNFPDDFDEPQFK